jgi:hypothetical protein
MAGEPPTREPRAIAIHPKVIWDGAAWVVKKVKRAFEERDDVKKVLDSGGRGCPNPECTETGNTADAKYCKRCGWLLDDV